MNKNADFTYTTDVIIGVGKPFQLFCIKYSNITNHRKLKEKWKNIRTLEYMDSTGTDVKLSDEDIDEVIAIVPFRNYLQNKLDPKTKYPVDIKKYSCEDFLHYYDDEYDPENPTKYDRASAMEMEK